MIKRTRNHLVMTLKNIVLVDLYLRVNNNVLLLPADLKLDFGRPIWMDVDLGLLEKLKDFTTDLNMEHTELENDGESSSDSEITSIIRSVAISTDYVAITAIAGRDRKVDPTVKVSCSSMNLGVSLKADHREGILYMRSIKYSNYCFPEDIKYYLPIVFGSLFTSHPPVSEFFCAF